MNPIAAASRRSETPTCTSQAGAEYSTHQAPKEGGGALQKNSSISYMVHLDGIRAFAVGGVILEHWVSGMPRAIREVVDYLDLGAWGVECFFVLSGFLITQLLLHAKAKGQTLGTALGHFYARRALRIFPAYYLVLLLGVLFHPEFREYAGWHVFYLGNLYPLWHDTFVPVGGHFWSLAVEEQFYLVWPLVVLLLPTRKVMALALILCALAPLSRLALWSAMNGIHLSMWTFPLTTVDLLGFGAFLACAKHEFAVAEHGRFAKTVRLLGLLGLILYAAGHVFAHDAVLFTILARSFAALAFGALIFQASFGFNGVLGALFGNKLLVWVGMVSYGLYLFHPFIPPIYLHAIRALGLSTDFWGLYYVRLPLITLLLLLFTSASYYFLEKPVRKLRVNFR